MVFLILVRLAALILVGCAFIDHYGVLAGITAVLVLWSVMPQHIVRD